MSERWTYEHTFRVPAAPEAVFAAWTDEARLRAWFAEHARVDANEGGSFCFWGRHTVGTPAEGEGGGAITDLRPGERLAFEWTLFGVPSEVTISLSPEETETGTTTRVTIEHDFERLFDMPRPKEIVDDWWRLCLGNLTAHATGVGEPLLLDLADDHPEVRLEMYMEAPPAKVFRALTEPEALNRWIAKDARVDLRVGGVFDLGFVPADEHDRPPMRILELEEGRKLTLSWPDWRGDTSVPVQSVTWRLEPEGSGTRVTLIHSGFVRAVDVSDYPFGWGHFMRRLAGVVESD